MKKLLIVTRPGQRPETRQTRTEMFVRMFAKYSSHWRYDVVWYDEVDIFASSQAVSILIDRKDVSQYDIIWFRNHEGKEDIAVAVSDYIRAIHNNIIVINAVSAKNYTPNKLHQVLQAHSAGIDIPTTVYCTRRSSYLETQAKLNTTTWVTKQKDGARGENSYLIRSEAEYNNFVDKHPDVDNFILQEFLPNDGDYRFNVFGDQVVNCIKRTRNHPESEFRNNVVDSKKQLVSLASIPQVVLDHCTKFAQICGYQVSALDWILYNDVWYMLEINHAPGMKAFHTEELAGKYFDSLLP